MFMKRCINVAFTLFSFHFYVEMILPERKYITNAIIVLRLCNTIPYTRLPT